MPRFVSEYQFKVEFGSPDDRRIECAFQNLHNYSSAQGTGRQSRRSRLSDGNLRVCSYPLVYVRAERAVPDVLEHTRVRCFFRLPEPCP